MFAVGEWTCSAGQRCGLPAKVVDPVVSASASVTTWGDDRNCGQLGLDGGGKEMASTWG